MELPIGPNGPLFPWAGLREPVSAISHAVGAIVALAAMRPLIRGSAGDAGKRASMVVYGLSLVILLAASALYHSLQRPPDELVAFRKLDHGSIFVLIAGTFTPFYVNATRGWWRTGNLMLIWSVAMAGIVCKIVWIDMPDAWSSGLYVAMGWMAMFGYRRFAAALSHRAMMLTLLGGVFYSAGAVIDAVQWPVLVAGYVGYHEVLHALVLLAAATHYFVVRRYLLPFRLDAVEPQV